VSGVTAKTLTMFDEAEKFLTVTFSPILDLSPLGNLANVVPIADVGSNRRRSPYFAWVDWVKTSDGIPRHLCGALSYVSR